MKPCSVGSMLKDQSNGHLCVKKMKQFSWIDVERPIKYMLMYRKDKALLGWVDVERPTKQGALNPA